MSDSRPETETGAAAGPTTEYVADETYAAKVLGSFFRFQMLRPMRVVLLALLFLDSIFLVPGLLHLQGEIGFAAGLGIAVLLLLLIGGLVYLRIRPRIRLIAGPGVYSCTADSKALTFRTPLSTSTTSYRAYIDAVRRDGLVYLKHRNAAIYVMLPAELFPGETFEQVRSRIKAA